MIWLDELSKQYEREKPVFEKVSMLIPGGVRIGVLGDPGSGKSTLLKLIGGVELPSSGRVAVEGRLLWPGSIQSAMNNQMTLLQNLRFLGRLYTEEDSEMEVMIERIMEIAQIEDFRDTLWSKVPATHKPRLKYAVMIAVPVDWLLIEGSLSPKKDERFLEMMERKMLRTNTLLISSNKKILTKYCDAGIVIHQKKLHYFDSIRDALKFYKSESSQ